VVNWPKSKEAIRKIKTGILDMINMVI